MPPFTMNRWLRQIPKGHLPQTLNGAWGKHFKWKKIKDAFED